MIEFISGLKLILEMQRYYNINMSLLNWIAKFEYEWSQRMSRNNAQESMKRMDN